MAASATASQGIEVLTIPDVRASQSFDGEDVTLALGTLRVLLVTIDLEQTASTDKVKQQAQESYATDLWLVLAIGQDFSLPIPANQTIRPLRIGGATSYTMPSNDVQGASINLGLPMLTSKDDMNRLERILSQYSAYQDDDPTDNGAIELMDAQGRVLGTIKGNFDVKEDEILSEAGNEKNPVLIDLPPEPVDGIGTETMHVGMVPKGEAQQKGDWMLKGADFVSRGLVRGSEFIGSKITGAADSYTSTRPAVGTSQPLTPQNAEATSADEKSSSGTSQAGREPIKVHPTAQSGASTLYQWSGRAVQVSSKTTGAILSVATNLGDKVGKKTGIQRQVKSDGTLGPEPKGIRGFVNRSLLATETLLNGIDVGAQNILFSGGDAASRVVGHRYGDDAKNISENVVKTGKNVFLVYKDVRGVRRGALLKAVGGRAMRAKLQDGTEVVLHVDENGMTQALQSDNVDAKATSTTEKPAPSSNDLNLSTNLPPPRHPRSGNVSPLQSSTPTSSLPPPPAHPSRSGASSPSLKK